MHGTHLHVPDLQSEVVIGVCILEPVLDETGIICFWANLHDNSLLVGPPVHVSIGEGLTAAPISVLGEALELHIDVVAVPGDFAHDVLGEEAITFLPEPVLLDAREVARVVDHWVQVLQLIRLQAVVGFLGLGRREEQEE